MISKRLLSDNSKDVELARKLLGFIPCIAEGCQDDNIKQYRNTVKWINNNIKFLYYTGEHFFKLETLPVYGFVGIEIFAEDCMFGITDG
jgi:hypothetical protein